MTKKKTIITTEKKVKPTVSRSTAAAASNGSGALIFNKSNYVFMGIGLALIVLGLLLMIGGSMPDNNTWDDDIIYSFRITVLAPILILAGLGVEIYAIFKK